MKTITLPAGNWLFVAAQVQDIEDGYYIQDSNPIIPLLSFMGNANPIILPPGQWQIFSLASEMTEALAAQMVNKNQYGHNGWKVYTEKSGLCFWSTSALESFATLMAVHGMYTKNPLGERPRKPDVNDAFINPNYSQEKRNAMAWSFNKSIEKYDLSLMQWQSYESKVSEYIILKEVK